MLHSSKYGMLPLLKLPWNLTSSYKLVHNDLGFKEDKCEVECQHGIKRPAHDIWSVSEMKVRQC